MNYLVAWLAERLPVVYIESKFGMFSERLNMVRMKRPTTLFAHLTGIVVTLKHSFTPLDS